jgi:hypothetical protein
VSHFSEAKIAAVSVHIQIQAGQPAPSKIISTGIAASGSHVWTGGHSLPGCLADSNRVFAMAGTCALLPFQPQLQIGANGRPKPAGFRAPDEPQASLDD